ncbi:hypothetical protein KL943_003179 [Ogataea angusta]|nr:hypothetical protein KL943_003179 [Ogataea angusta]
MHSEKVQFFNLVSGNWCLDRLKVSVKKSARYACIIQDKQKPSPMCGRYKVPSFSVTIMGSEKDVAVTTGQVSRFSHELNTHEVIATITSANGHNVEITTDVDLAMKLAVAQKVDGKITVLK